MFSLLFTSADILIRRASRPSCSSKGPRCRPFICFRLETKLTFRTQSRIEDASPRRRREGKARQKACFSSFIHHHSSTTTLILSDRIALRSFRETEEFPSATLEQQPSTRLLGAPSKSLFSLPSAPLPFLSPSLSLSLSLSPQQSRIKMASPPSSLFFHASGSFLLNAVGPVSLLPSICSRSVA